MGTKAISGVPASALCRLHLDATVGTDLHEREFTDMQSSSRTEKRSVSNRPTAAWLATALAWVRQERLAFAALEENYP